MSRKPVVVFVCEHGSAKSVVAAALFNRLAGARGLHVRAVARGTNPDEAIAPAAATGLHADGLASGETAPTRLSEGDLVAASRVVAFWPPTGGVPRLWRRGGRAMGGPAAGQRGLR